MGARQLGSSGRVGGFALARESFVTRASDRRRSHSSLGRGLERGDGGVVRGLGDDFVSPHDAGAV